MKTYKFRVSLPGYPGVWRTIEMRGDQTLEDLHLAIQHAYAFDNDHMYSFFMSGKPWDHETEYSLLEGGDPWGLSDLLDEASAEDEDAEPASGEGGEGALDEDAFEAEVAGMQSMLAALGVPPETVQTLGDVMRDDSLSPQEKIDQLKVAIGPVLGPLAGLLDNFALDDSPEDEDDEELVGDVRTTTIDELNLRTRKKFLYLFDYGDEWRFDVRVQAIDPKAPEGQYPRIVESAGEAPSQYPDLEDYDDEDEDWAEDDLDGEDEGDEGDAE